MSFSASIEELIYTSTSPLISSAPWWNRVSLGDIANILNGYPFKSTAFNKAEGIPVIRIRDVTAGKVITYYQGSPVDGYWVEPGEIIIGMDGDFNCRQWPDVRAQLNQRVCKVTPNDSFYDRTFLAYVLPGYLKLINDATHSITVKHLSSKTISEIPLPLPPLAEQKRIVAKLDALMARSSRARDALAQIPRLIERYKQAVLAAAFRGDLTADWRALNETTSPQRSLEQLRNHRQKDKKLSKRKKILDLPDVSIPSSWIWGSPDEIADNTPYSIGIGPFGSNLVKTDYRETGVRLIFVRDIRQESFTEQNARFISPEKASELHQHFAIGGDVLITKMGDPPGDTALYPEEAKPAIITADCIKLRPHQEIAIALYLVYCIRAELIRVQMNEITAGVAQQKVSLDRFRQIALPIPPLEEQVEIVKRITIAFDAIENIGTELTQAQNLRTRLEQATLAKAFRGELVPQDPNDEPASALLERIRTEREATPAKKSTRAKAKTKTKTPLATH